MTGAPATPPVMDLDARRRAIAASLAAAGGETHVVPGQGGYVELPLAGVPDEALLYRVDNGRLLAELAHAAEARGTTLAALRAAAATPAVQQLLHDLLLAKASDPRAPIHDELAHHRRQTEPLLVGRDGVVLNGNRRLASMRALRARDAAGYATFATVQAAVLPADISAGELDFIEAALQMAPVLRLDYGWINRRLKLRQHSRELDRSHIVAAYRLDGDDRIDVELAELDLAEAYLAWSGEAGRYERLADAEAPFVALRQQLAAVGHGELRELWRTLGFALIHAAPALDAEILHYHPFADPRPPGLRQWVPRTMAEERGLVARQQPGENRGLDARTAARLRTAVAAPEAAVATASEVLALTDTLRSDAAHLLGATRILQQLRAARRTLEAQDEGTLTPTQRRQMRAELASLLAILDAWDEPLAPRRRGPRPVRALAPALRRLRARTLAAWRRFT